MQTLMHVSLLNCVILPETVRHLIAHCAGITRVRVVSDLPGLSGLSHSFRTAFTDLNLYWIKGALALFVLVSGYVC